ncbi:hypothetical protein D3C76_1090060 [compost metagenome]
MYATGAFPVNCGGVIVFLPGTLNLQARWLLPAMRKKLKRSLDAMIWYRIMMYSILGSALLYGRSLHLDGRMRIVRISNVSSLQMFL